jgi:hypothetical protein
MTTTTESEGSLPRPGVVFLGLAERAAVVFDGSPNLPKWNVLGLKHVVVSNFYPLSFSHWYIGLAVKDPETPGSVLLRFVDDAGTEIGTITFATTKAITEFRPASEGRTVLVLDQGWFISFVRIGNTPISIPRPGMYLVQVQRHLNYETVGQLYFGLVEAPPLTAERIAAIRSDPKAMKAVRVNMACNKCQTKLLAYAGLERSTKQEEEGCIWYQDLPDEFVCACGATRMDLSSMRRNLFAPLGQPLPQDEEKIGYVPLYERSALEALHVEFLALLDSSPSEEVLQQFIQDNPILLHQFPADKLFFKPSILTFFRADFAIVTPQKELLLVEIETTRTRLLKANGGEAAPLRHAIDQVHSWIHVVDEHRLAVLDSLGVTRDLVSSIKGVVIAGRDRGYDAEHLRRLKGIDRGRVVLLTYDDLAFGLGTLGRRMSRL